MNPNTPFHALSNDHIEKEPTIIESPYEIVQRPIDEKTAYAICELLGLDPNKTNKILVEADGTLNGELIGALLTVTQMKGTK